MASAKPATMPLSSLAGTDATAETTPDVPTETMTSPGRACSPRAAAMLSPVPGPDAAPSVSPGTAVAAGGVGGREDAGQDGVVTQGGDEQVPAVVPGRRRPVPGAGGVAAVGHEVVEVRSCPAAAR